MGTAECGCVQRSVRITFSSKRRKSRSNQREAFGYHFTTPKDSFALSDEAFAEDMAVNTTSAFVAVHEALSSFKALGTEEPRTFIYIGRPSDEDTAPGLLSIGMAKAASARMIGMADFLYKGEGMRFFYVDERHLNGSNMNAELGGQMHAEFFLNLAERTIGDVLWQATYVRDKGYTAFPQESRT